MKNTFRLLAVIFAAVSIFAAGSVCHSEDSQQELKTFRGQVAEVDWVGSLITCQGGDETTFYAPPGIKIRYGTDTASLEDLEQGDYVLIKYTDNPTGTPKAVSISLNKSYPEF
ncbi:MAG: hypothetical protein Q7S30_01885 [Candidatus Omnitrophota bacterium]|nr:hypothetical protein [Candidatus Omnitrophota bacterium]